MKPKTDWRITMGSGYKMFCFSLFCAALFAEGAGDLIENYGHRPLFIKQAIRLPGSDQKTGIANTIKKQLAGFEGENQLDPVWESHFTAGLASGFIMPTAIAVDESGNVYVSGCGKIQPFGFKIFTTKYSPAGEEIWSVRYDEEGIGDCWSSDMAIDASGNLYVAGSCTRSGEEFNYTVIKYNSDGIQQWAVHYNGAANSQDMAASIAVDHSGKVFVTGSSVGEDNDSDYATVCYDAEGVEQWVARYQGPAGTDTGRHIVIDNSGNVYVSGFSTGVDTGEDYATIKYSAEGVELWVVRYDGPGHAWDMPAGLVVDDDGNVTVTGNSQGQDTNTEFATVQYNASGQAMWTARYHNETYSSYFYAHANSIALDGEGNVYVTGTSDFDETSGDVVTIKYSRAGSRQWLARYDGPGESHDSVEGLSIDKDGNVYVTGGSAGYGRAQDIVLIKYNNSGIVEWASEFNGPGDGFDRAMAVAVDGDGNVVTTGYVIDPVTDDSECATLKYSADGEQQWAAYYGGGGNTAEHSSGVSGLIVDNSGNLIVSGCSEHAGHDYDIMLVKYGETGELLWSARYDGPANESDHTYAMTVDAFDNIYLAGKSVGIETQGDYVLVKYSPAGQQLWAGRYDGPASDYDSPTAIATDPDGNILVTGGSSGTGSGMDFATVKYSSEGQLIWVSRFDGPAHEYDRASAMAHDGDGNVFVTGESWNGESSGRHNFQTIKYNPSGEEIWTIQYNGPGDDSDIPNDLIVDTAGNVYVCGRSIGVGSEDDFTVVKYNSAGEEVWVTRFDGPGKADDEAVALKLDGSGNIYVTGYCEGIDSGADYVTLKLNSSGEILWIRSFNGSGNGDDSASAMAIDEKGHLYVTGVSAGFNTGDDYLTLKYDSGGNELWHSRVDGVVNTSDEATAIALDGSGHVYVTGNVSGVYWEMIKTLKYEQPAVGVQNPEVANLPEEISIFQNYPNPFNPFTMISFQVQKPCRITLKIYDVIGHEVKTLVDEDRPAGVHQERFEVGGLASGVYFCVLERDYVKQETIRMTLMK